MRKRVATTIACILLSACDPSSSITFHKGSGVTLTMSGAVQTVKDTFDVIRDAGSLVIGTVQSVRRDVTNRVDKIQEGAEKLQEGSELIKEGIGE